MLKLKCCNLFHGEWRVDDAADNSQQERTIINVSITLINVIIFITVAGNKINRRGVISYKLLLQNFLSTLSDRVSSDGEFCVQHLT